MLKIIVHGIELPIAQPEHFITPDWDAVLRFFPVYQARAKAAGQKPYDAFPPYMHDISRQLPDRGGTRKPDDWCKRYFEHWGIDHFAKMVNRAGKIGGDIETEIEPRARQLKQAGLDWMDAEVQLCLEFIGQTGIHDTIRRVYLTPWRRVPKSLIKPL